MLKPVLFIFVIALTAFLGFGLKKFQPEINLFFHVNNSLDNVFVYSTYYFLWATLLFVLFTLKRDGWRERLCEVRVPLAVGVILTTVVFLAVGTEFRVLADETNLIATSLSLHLNKTLNNVTQALPYYDSLHLIKEEVAARPALYPFIVALLHAVGGFNPAHGFVANFGVSVGMLALITHIGTRLHSRTLGVTAAVLLAAFPLYGLIMTSCGFDAINLLFITAVFWQLRRFIQNPSGRAVELLLLTWVLAAHCRYESIILAVPIAIVFLSRPHTIFAFTYSWRLPLIPLLTLPHIWQRLIAKHLANAGDDNDVAFGREYILPHFKGFLDFFFNRSTDLPNAWLIVVLAGLGIVLFVVKRLISKERLQPDTIFWFSVSVMGIALIALVHISYYFGDIRKPWIMRLAHIYLGFFCLWAAYLLTEAWRGIGGRIFAGACAVFLLAFYLPLANRNDAGKSLLLYREYKVLRKFFKDKPVDGHLIIAERPGLYVALGHGAVDFGYANNRAEDLKSDLERHLYQEIWVVQHLDYETHEPEESLNALLPIRPVFSFQNAADEYVRVSQVVE